MVSLEPTIELKVSASEAPSGVISKINFIVFPSDFCYFIFSNLVIELGNKFK